MVTQEQLDRYKELQDIGWKQMKGDLRKEYQMLKKLITREHEEKVEEPVVEVKLPKDDGRLAGYCQRLYKQIKDGNERAIILRYKSLKTSEPLENTLRQLMKDLKLGDARGAVYGIIKEINPDA